MLTDTIANMVGPEYKLRLGSTSSVKVDEKPIAGHGQFISKKQSFLYHGVIAISDWDTQMIENLLKITREDFEKITTLPSIKSLVKGDKDATFYKGALVNDMLSRFPKANFKHIPTSLKSEILEEAQRLQETKYESRDWIYRSDIRLRQDTRFCILSFG
jgi:lipoate-protein ligase A